jgi:transglutaminase-like putative cysteine protease
MLLAMGAMAALVAAAWFQLESTAVPAAGLARTLAFALAPALCLLLSGRRLVGLAALALVLLPATGYAFGVPVTHMRTGDVDFFGPLFARIHDGFSDFYATRVPFARGEHPYMEGVLLVAVFLFVAVPSLLLAARRPLVAGLVFVLGVGWPATIAATIPGATPLRTGAVILAAVFLVLFLTGEKRRPARTLAPAVVFSVVLVAVAVGASSSGAVAKAGVFHWQRWNYEQKVNPVGVRYVWSSSYAGISFPKKPTEVLRIKGPGADRSLYWRATTLDEYTGVGWRENLYTGRPLLTPTLQAALRDPLLPAPARNPANWTEQEVTVKGLSDTHLIAASIPVKWEPADGQAVQYATGGVVLVPAGLEQDEHYKVWSYTPEVDPAALAKLSANYPPSLARFLDIVPGSRVPAFGTPHRDALVRATLRKDPLLAEYEPMYELTRKVVGKAKSPYVAAAALETWFRDEGGFSYNEKPQQPLNGEPPLLDFVLRTKEGYCQHYAGAMALMLRMLGVPARVAAGFTSGTYDKNRSEWVVTDRNAHTWVEVYFPRFGWLPFDPTPGRGVLGVGSSTTSPAYSLQNKALLESFTALGAPSALQARLRNANAKIQGRVESGTPGADRFTADGKPVAASSGPSIPLLVVAVLGGALLLLLGAKAVRRGLRFRSRDPRHVAAACRRDLVAYLADQRVIVARSATLDDVGKFVERTYRVNAVPFVRAALAARFGPPGRVEVSARRARRELRQLERAIRRQLSWTTRIRGVLNVRSFTI